MTRTPPRHLEYWYSRCLGGVRVALVSVVDDVAQETDRDLLTQVKHAMSMP
jgi:hypothetical protein